MGGCGGKESYNYEKKKFKLTDTMREGDKRQKDRERDRETQADFSIIRRECGRKPYRNIFSFLFFFSFFFLYGSFSFSRFSKCLFVNTDGEVWVVVVV